MPSLRRPLPAALLACLALACGDASRHPGPVRLVELVASGADAEPEVLAGGMEVGPRPVTLEVALPAERVARLRVTAAGDANLIRLTWRLAGDGRFRPFRSLSFPLSPDGEEHVYDVDLRREPYWTGTVVGLRLVAEEGTATLREVVGLGSRSPRVTSLAGLTLPSLGGARYELPLPPDLPRRATFDARLGLLPRFEDKAVTAHFRAWVEGPGGERRDWLDERITGGGGPPWRPVSRRVEVPRGGKLVLEASASWDGAALPDGSAVWGSPLLLPAGDRAAGPNLLVVVVDTLRADLLGAYGGPPGLTPNLDAFAREAVRFDDLATPAPWTLPSVATLLTGYQPGVHGAGRQLGEFIPTALGPSPPTLAELLADSGLRTAGIYNNIYLNPSFGLERGFDHYAWFETTDDVLVDRALEQLDVLRDERHFLFLHLFGPHHPYMPPDPPCRSVARRFAPDHRGEERCHAERSDVPTIGEPPPPVAERPWIEGLYRAEVAFTDQQLGRLFAGLAERGLDRDTVILVVSDHGEAFWERLDQQERLGYLQADHGHTLYEELLRVPALLRAPSREPGVFAGPAEMADLLPTLLALLGVGAPPVQGLDLVPLLDGGAAERRTRTTGALLYGAQRRAVRRGDWKLVVPADDPSLPVELYDLAADPGEVRNLAAERPDVVAGLRALAERDLGDAARLRRRLLAQGEDVLESTYLEWNHVTKLRSLGYLK